MSIGTIFFVIALIIFFLIGAHIVPIEIVWGFFCLTLGFLTAGYTFPKIG